MTGKTNDWEPLSFEGLRTTSLHDRPSKVRLEDAAQPWQRGATLREFVRRLPRQLAGGSFREAVRAVAAAVSAGRTVLLGMGAHPVKVGLNPLLVDAVRRGILTGIAMNGAGVIHDVELALAGKTSEDVAAHLELGTFGTARETAEFIHGAVLEGFRRGGRGLGRAVGERLLEAEAPHRGLSLLAVAAECGVPVTVHVAIGTDIIHMHPQMDGAATGALSHYDFRLFSRLVSTLADGVFINLGSAVVIPEVFLKAVSVAANLGFSLDGITAINMDFMRHYRPRVNVLERPTAGRGRGIELIGHHELLLPLLFAAVIEELEGEGG
ncbi:MAG: hypothetical protein SWC40_09905 [Thermodesulfobacteriota bacterium]|nr:hypothetical protein [Thermodesulfobacteriota bacterium]